jgi:hypothetical protein
MRMRGWLGMREQGKVQAMEEPVRGDDEWLLVELCP